MKKHTVCRMCSSCCPVEVTVKDGRLVSARRKTGAGPGAELICPKLAAAAEIVYSPERLKTPLVRKDRSASFAPASWDAALNLVAEELSRAKKEQGAGSVGWLRGMAADWGAPWDYASRLMHAFGSPNCIGNGSVCHVAREMAHNYTYGAMIVPQAGASRCIVVWGKNDRNTCPPAHEAIIAARRKGAALIVVDPVKTPLAREADIFLQLKPGSDGPLAMAMIREILRNGLHDQEFVQGFTVGFEPLARAADKFPAEKIAPEIWLDPEEVKRAARLYATTKPACIVEGNGLDMQLNTFQATRAVCILRALTGNLDRPGGDFLPQPVPAQNIRLSERLPGDVQPVTAAYPLFSSFHPTWGLHAQSCLVDAILDRKPYPVTSLVVQSGNPAVTMTDSGRTAEALSRLSFLAVIDMFPTRTASFAHVVLPACGCFEKTQLNRAYLRNLRVVLQDKAIEPLHESRPDWWIVFALARRLGLSDDFPWTDVEQAIDFQLAPSGITVEKLRQHPEGIAAGEPAFEKFRTRGFSTPSGKAELFSGRLHEAGKDGVPFPDGKAADALAISRDDGQDLLVGVSGERSARFTHSQFHHIQSLRQNEPEALADFHLDDASRRGIGDGDRVKVETPRGRICLRARISDEVHRGSVRIGWGWGESHPEANLNNLTDDGMRDPVTCTPSNRSFLCRVEKAE
ncbi:MAG: molybdopterin-dependent oxidoreductase [Thermodesulfobacteriota bacterium]